MPPRARDTELLREATKIKVKAERVAGQMLFAMSESGERGLGRRKKSIRKLLFPTCKLPACYDASFSSFT